MNLLRVNQKRRCPACGKSDWCLLDPAGKFAVCMRVRSDVQTKSGRGYIHSTDGRAAASPASVSKLISPIPTAPCLRPTAEHINEVYAALLDELTLSAGHKQSLAIRGLSELLIHVHGYKSMPKTENARHIAGRLSRRFSLDGVPGFYLERGAWHFQTYFASGFLVPIRNYRHQIVALTLRRDDARKPKYMLVSSADKTKGASSGAPPHFALLGGNFRRAQIQELIITEGALKANVIASYLQQPVVGLVGVGCFDAALPELLRESFPNLAKVKIAFDMDARSNAAVLHQRERLTKVLQSDFTTRILTWHEAHKGLDDYLLHQSANRKGEARA